MWPRLIFCTGNSGEKVRNINSTLLNYKDLVGQLPADQRLESEGKLHRHLFCGRTEFCPIPVPSPANYWLSEIYDQEVAQAHRKRRFISMTFPC